MSTEKKFQQLTSERIKYNEDVECLEDQYAQFRYALTKSAQLLLPVVERTVKQIWMIAPILQKMDQRCLAKEKEDLYNLLDREIRYEGKAAKENMQAAQCDVIEQFGAAHKTNLTHSQIRLVTGWKRRSNLTTTEVICQKSLRR